MTYKQKLLDPRWQRKRLEVMERDNFSCRFCEDNENTLHIHHLHYDKELDPWDYSNDVLITLCKDCHEIEKDTRFLKLKELFDLFLKTPIDCEEFVHLKDAMEDTKLRNLNDWFHMIQLLLYDKEYYDSCQDMLYGKSTT